MHSEHFTEAELACHHCGVNGVVQELLDALEYFRALLGQPVIVNDAYRCPVHNAAVGGAPHSYHAEGRAADIRVTNMTARELYKFAVCVAQFTGIGVDDHKQYIHVDVRGRFFHAKWCYDKDGQVERFYLTPATAVSSIKGSENVDLETH
jgi:uncharacterized protein YcbK (DUF882 family)